MLCNEKSNASRSLKVQRIIGKGAEKVEQLWSQSSDKMQYFMSHRCVQYSSEMWHFMILLKCVNLIFQMNCVHLSSVERLKEITFETSVIELDPP